MARTNLTTEPVSNGEIIAETWMQPLRFASCRISDQPMQDTRSHEGTFKLYASVRQCSVQDRCEILALHIKIPRPLLIYKAVQ